MIGRPRSAAASAGLVAIVVLSGSAPAAPRTSVGITDSIDQYVAARMRELRIPAWR